MAKIPSWPIIEQGNSGKNVYALQCLLNYRNNNSALSIDGGFGPATYSAVFAYQQSNNLFVDGRAGEGTLTKLTANLVIQNRTTNNAARAAQHLISKFESLSIDGDFGGGSASTTQTFQQKMGISSNGIVDASTWQYLFGYNTYPSPVLSTLSISSMTVPDPLTQGNGVTVSGSVTSNYTITLVKAEIKNSSGVVMYTVTKSPGTTSYNLSNLDNNLLFSQLPQGQYTYTITAQDSNSTVETHTQTFQVAAQNSSYTDYQGLQIFTPSQLTLLTANKSFYQNAGQMYGIPWQMIAAIHYRENSLKKSGPSNGTGPYQISGNIYPIGAYTDAQFQGATNDAAAFIKSKAGSKELSDPDNVKNTFFAYNGKATVYVTQAINLGLTQMQADNGEGSPYVMNRFDAMRDPTVSPTNSNNTWGQIKTNGAPLSYPANSDYGAFVIYSTLL